MEYDLDMKSIIPETPAYRRFLLLVVLVVFWLVSAGCSQERSETLTIAFSNDMNGEIRSCGCAADDFGGLGRRATVLHIVRDSTENFLLLDAGDFFGRDLNYGKEKADVTMKSMVLMGYDGVVLGEKEFGFGVDYIVKRTEEIGLPVLAANLYDAGSDSLLFPPSWVVNFASGLNVGLIGVVGSLLKMPTQVPTGRLRIGDPKRAVQREIEELGDDVDIIVVLAHMPRGEAWKIVSDIPDVDLVVSGHDGKPMRTIRRVGNGFILQNSSKGLYMGVAFAVLQKDRRGIGKLTNQFLPLSQIYQDDEAISKLFRSYDMSVAAKAKSAIPAAVFEARAGLKKPFAGSETCRECHESEYDIWESSGHAKAFAILEERSRQYDKDCTPCHTTGYYALGGFERLALTPQLVDVGCEACHGNGHDHVRDPDASTPGEAAESCRACHNADQSPDFDFDTRWAHIQH
jgi:hypothetical protein